MQFNKLADHIFIGYNGVYSLKSIFQSTISKLYFIGINNSGFYVNPNLLAQTQYKS